MRGPHNPPRTVIFGGTPPRFLGAQQNIYHTPMRSSIVLTFSQLLSWETTYWRLRHLRPQKPQPMYQQMYQVLGLPWPQRNHVFMTPNSWELPQGHCPAAKSRTIAHPAAATRIVVTVAEPVSTCQTERGTN